MEKKQQIEVVKETLKQYLLPDCLQPKWDGMSLHELSSIVLRELEKAEEFNGEGYYNNCYCKKCGSEVQCEHSFNEPHVKSLCGNCV